MGKVARLGVDQLQASYEEIVPKLTFLRKYVITIVPLGLTEQLLTVSDPGLLKRLEAITPVPSFAEFSIDTDLRQALGIPDDARLLMGGWGYDNMSMELPGRGIFNGRPRKVALGGFFQEIEPPLVDGKWMEFKTG